MNISPVDPLWSHTKLFLQEKVAQESHTIVLQEPHMIALQEPQAIISQKPLTLTSCLLNSAIFCANQCESQKPLTLTSCLLNSTTFVRSV